MTSPAKDRDRPILAIPCTNIDEYRHLLLGQFGQAFQVVTVDTAESLGKQCRAEAVDVIVWEVGGGGCSVRQQLTALQTQLGNAPPPIIAIGENDVDDAMEAVKAGAVDYLVAARLTADRLHAAIQTAMANGANGKNHTLTQEKVLADPRFRAIAHYARVDVWLSAPDGRCSFMSDGWESLTGHSPEAAIGGGWVSFVHPDDRDRVSAIFHDATTQQQPFSFDYRLRGADGIYRWTLCAGQPCWNDEGEFLGFSGIDISIQDRKDMEMALRLSEEQRHLVLDLTGIGWWDWDVLTGRFTWSDRLFELLGYEPGAVEPSDEKWRDLIHPDDLEWTSQLLEQVLEKGILGEAEYRVVHPDGSVRWLLVKAQAVYNDEGQAVRMPGIVMDVSDRKRQEANAAFLAEITEVFSRQPSAPEIVQTVGEKVGNYLNVAACKFCKVDEANDELTYFGSWERGDAPPLPNAICLSEQVSDGFMHQIRRGETVVSCDTGTNSITQGQANEALGVCSFIAVPLLNDGCCKYLFCVHDIEPRIWQEDEIDLLQSVANRVFPRLERAQFEAALRESEIRFKGFAENSKDVIWISDKEHRELIYVSPSFEEIWDRPAEELYGDLSRLLEYIHPDDRDRVQQTWHRYFPKACQTFGYTQEYRIIRPDGSIAWIRDRCFPIFRAQGELMWIGGIAENISDRKEAEALLTASRDTFRHLVEHSPFGVFVVDSDFCMAKVSVGAQKVLKNAEPLLGRDFAEIMQFLWPEPLASDIIARFHHTLATGDPYQAPSVTERRQDTQQIESYDWRIERLMLPDGQYGVVCHFYDLSERLRYEAALRESEERFRSMADQAPMMVWVTDPAGYCTYLSQSWYDFTGQTEEEGIGDGWEEMIHPSDRAETDRRFLEALERQEPVRLEYRLRDKNGDYVWVIDAANPWFGEDGTLRGYVGSVLDISDRKAAEAAISADLEDTRRLRDLSTRLTTEGDIQVLYEEIVATAMAIVRSDAGSLQFYNAKTGELQLLAAFNFSKNMMEQFDLIAASSKTSCGQALSQRKRAFVDFDAPVPDPDGSLKLHLDVGLLSAQSTPLFSRSGQCLGMFSTHWRKHYRPSDRELRFLDLLARQAADLIEQRRAEVERQQLLERERLAREEAEYANRTKDEFLAILSHELRSPLNPILGWSKLLRTRQLDAAKTAQALATIERNAELQTQLIDDLLDIARILRGKLKIEETVVSLETVIEAAIEVVKTAAEAKSISLRSVFARGCFVRGDEGRLQQVVWNLLSNAIKFTSTGGRVEIHLEAVNGLAQITVTDTGKGIRADFLPYLFQSFRQEDVSITRRYGGLGLGLAIVKYLVDAHGGSVSAASPGEDQGSTFTVRLPLHLAAAPASPSTKQPALAEEALRDIKVLVVDDNADACELLNAMLSEHGARVAVVDSGAEALARVQAFCPDVLMCDIVMPEMDGYTLLKQIRALPTEHGGAVPAIAVTAFAREEDRQNALRLGFQHHLAKPLSLEAVVLAILALTAPA